MVLVNDIVPEDKAKQLFAEYDKVGYFRSATSSLAAADALVKASVKRFGRVPDTVLCHAGIVESHPIDDCPVEAFDRTIGTNIRSGFLLARAASSVWKSTQAKGHLIFTSSWVAESQWPGIAPYGALKAAMNSPMRSFARELAPFGIRANAVAPGIVGASMAQRQWDTEPDYRQRAQKAIPLGALQSTDSVANAFLFLASGMANYMTGSVLVVDGGCSLYPMDQPQAGPGRTRPALVRPWASPCVGSALRDEGARAT